MFDPEAGVPRINRGMVYLGACLIAGIRLARERQVNVRVVPTGKAIEESVDLAYEIFNRVFRRVPKRMARSIILGNVRSVSNARLQRNCRWGSYMPCPVVDNLEVPTNKQLRRVLVALPGIEPGF